MDTPQIAQVRHFNRTITQRIGALSSSYLDSGRPLGEARLIFEIGEHGATIRALRARLGLDSGYLSRMLRTLEAQGIAVTQRAAHDARVRLVTLTAKGHQEWEVLDQRSELLAASLLGPLGESQRQRLLSAMAEVVRFLNASAVAIEIADPFSEEAQTCISAYFTELQARFKEGFDPALTTSADPQELVAPAGWFLLARLDGVAVGCSGLKMNGPACAEVKRMWVAPQARGLGIAQRLLNAIEDLAHGAGIEVLQLDTNRSLLEARALYLRNGYAEIPPYNSNPYAHHWFEKRLR